MAQREWRVVFTRMRRSLHDGLVVAQPEPCEMVFGDEQVARQHADFYRRTGAEDVQVQMREVPNWSSLIP